MPSDAVWPTSPFSHALANRKQDFQILKLEFALGGHPSRESAIISKTACTFQLRVELLWVLEPLAVAEVAIRHHKSAGRRLLRVAVILLQVVILWEKRFTSPGASEVMIRGQTDKHALQSWQK